MEEFNTWTDLLLSSVKSFGNHFVEFLPFLAGAISIFIIGWLVAKLASFIISKLLNTLKFDKLTDKMNLSEYLQKANIKSSPSQLIGKIVFWFLMLLVIISASETLGWHAVSNEISKLISYLPNLLMAFAIFILGLFIASLIRDVIGGTLSSLGVSSGRILSNIVFYFLMVMISLTALEQAGFNTVLINTNLMLILGAILLSGAISYGFASRDVLSNILATYYNKQIYKEGMHIELDDIKGRIIKTNRLSITLENEVGDRLLIPAHRFISGQVKIFEENQKSE